MRHWRMLLAALVIAAPVPAAAGEDHDGPIEPMQVTAGTATDSILYAVKIADGNLVGVTITNYGFFGNNFNSANASLEYPLGAAIEHLVRGGLWIGAHAVDQDGPHTSVTTGALDGTQGGGSQSSTEFTPAGNTIVARSKLRNNQFFNRQAVSELDLISDFSDRPAKRSANNNENHRPLQIKVHQENYSWSFSDFQHINFIHLRIVNDGPPLENMWVGIYGEFASGDKGGYSGWPPTGANGGELGGWYRKKWIQYDDSLRLFREHYCVAKPTPTNCKLEIAPYWIGVKALGYERSLADTASIKYVTLEAWDWSPGNSERDEDVERYEVMSRGTINPLTDASLEPGTGDPVTLIAVGPFSQIDPGDTISVDFALVGGAEVPDIQQHARSAQRAFERDYIVPEPPESPKLRVVARHNALDLYWDDLTEDGEDPTTPGFKDFEGYRVYIGEDRLDLHLAAQFDKDTPPNDTTGFNTGLRDPLGRHGLFYRDTTFVGDTTVYKYRYTIDHLRDGFRYFVAVTAYDLGNAEIESLESGIIQNKTLAYPAPGPGERVRDDEVTVFPNPYRVEALWDQGERIRDHYLWFANLPERASLRIFTLSGDLVYETEFDGASYHGESARGVYDPRIERDVDPPTLSGRMFAWDMITKQGQAVATGLYMFAVKDKATGDVKRGKFLIVKSDREDF